MWAVLVDHPAVEGPVPGVMNSLLLDGSITANGRAAPTALERQRLSFIATESDRLGDDHSQWESRLQ